MEAGGSSGSDGDGSNIGAEGEGGMCDIDVKSKSNIMGGEVQAEGEVESECSGHSDIDKLFVTYPRWFGFNNSDVMNLRRSMAVRNSESLSESESIYVAEFHSAVVEVLPDSDSLSIGSQSGSTVVHDLL